jgi:hypothetical protein
MCDPSAPDFGDNETQRAELAFWPCHRKCVTAAEHRDESIGTLLMLLG